MRMPVEKVPLQIRYRESEFYRRSIKIDEWRMNTENNDNCLEFDNIRIFPVSRTVYAGSEEVALTRMEFDVLLFLVSNPDIAFTKEQIYEAVSRDAYSEAAYVIKDVVYRLRNKLGLHCIRTLHGYGYKFSMNKCAV